MSKDTSSRPSTVVLVVAGVAIAAAIGAIVVLTAGGSDEAATTTRPAASPAPADGPPAPTTEFEYFDGSRATFAAYEGRPLVVNFWASWCPPCIAEMSAAFRPVQQEMGDEVAFLGLNIQDERSKALQMVEDTGVLFDLAEDPRGDLYSELGGIGMPFTVFISADGTVVHRHNGAMSKGQLEDLINRHLLGA